MSDKIFMDQVHTQIENLTMMYSNAEKKTCIRRLTRALASPMNIVIPHVQQQKRIQRMLSHQINCVAQFMLMMFKLSLEYEIGSVAVHLSTFVNLHKLNHLDVSLNSCKTLLKQFSDNVVRVPQSTFKDHMFCFYTHTFKSTENRAVFIDLFPQNFEQLWNISRENLKTGDVLSDKSDLSEMLRQLILIALHMQKYSIGVLGVSMRFVMRSDENINDEIAVRRTSQDVMNYFRNTGFNTGRNVCACESCIHKSLASRTSVFVALYSDFYKSARFIGFEF